MRQVAKIAVIGLTGNTVFMGVPHFHRGGETVHAEDFHSELGGKGFNQAIAAARHGAEVSFLTAVGEDDEAKVRDVLASEGIAGTVMGKSVPSAHATILTDGTGETRVTVFPGARLDVDDLEGFEDAIASADILLLNNEVPEPVNVRASEIAVASGVRIIMNPAPVRSLPEIIKCQTGVFTPNEFETAGLEDVPGEVVTTLGALRPARERRDASDRFGRRRARRCLPRGECGGSKERDRPLRLAVDSAPDGLLEVCRLV